MRLAAQRRSTIERLLTSNATVWNWVGRFLYGRRTYAVTPPPVVVQMSKQRVPTARVIDVVVANPMLVPDYAGSLSLDGKIVATDVTLGQAQKVAVSLYGELAFVPNNGDDFTVWHNCAAPVPA